MTPHFHSINLLEQLTKLRKTFHLLDHQLIIKKKKKKTKQQPDGRNAKGKERGKGQDIPCPSRHTTLPKSPCGSLIWKLPKPCPFGGLWGLYYIVKLTTDSTSTSSTLPRRGWRVGRKIPTL